MNHARVTENLPKARDSVEHIDHANYIGQVPIRDVRIEQWLAQEHLVHVDHPGCVSLREVIAILSIRSGK